MKIFDKLKNALFEEEYVDVEEVKKPIKKEKPKEEKEEPIAKKIIIPKPIEKVEEDIMANSFDFDKEEEMLTDNSLINDTVVDKSFDVSISRTNRNSERNIDFYKDEEDPIIEKIEEVKPRIYKVEEPEIVIPGYGNKLENNSNRYSIEEDDPLGITGYEKKVDKTHFSPSPIISPIYGVLDKNYRKEEIVPKKEIRFNSRFDKQKLDLDQVRNKAYGHDDIEEVNAYNDFDDLGNTGTFSIHRFEEDVVVDLDETKPEVKEVTLGDATEYYDDLGLEYNNDYKDANLTGRRVKEDVEPVIETKVEVRESVVDNNKLDDASENDNLFDLIDSMYDKE